MKICIVGSQCVGKSTFISDILKEFPQFSTPTFTYRDAIREAGVENNINRKTNKQSQKLIFDALAEEIKRAGINTILDRSVMDAVAYSVWPTRYSGELTDITDQFVNNMFESATELMDMYDWIVYIPADDTIKIEDDNLRDTDPVYRKQIAEIFEELLLLDIEDPNFYKYGYKVVIVSGSRTERIKQFKELIQSII